MTRITRKDLQYAVDRLNQITGSPAEPYTRDETGRYRANIGNYHISGAYGGWSLQRMHTDGGGVTTPLYTGHIPARQLHGLIHAYINGLQDAKP